MKKIILILSAILLLASCEKHYYDPVVQIQEYEGQIPQEGEIIMIDYVYEPVETKFTAPTACPTLSDPMDCSLSRLLHPWDFPGKRTGVGCHCLLRQIQINKYK